MGISTESWYNNACQKTTSSVDALFLLAVASGHAWFLERMLNSYPNLKIEYLGHDPKRVGLLNYAIFQGYEKVVNTLLDFGADVDVASQVFDEDLLASSYSAIRPIHMALIRGHTEIFHNLINRGADILLQSERLLLGWGDSLDQTIPVATLHIAARYGSPDQLTALFKLNVDPNEVDQEGRNALDYATYISDDYPDHKLKIVHALIVNGVDPNLKDSFKQTPLDYAVKLPNNNTFIQDVVSELLLARPDALETNSIYTIEEGWVNPEPEKPVKVDHYWRSKLSNLFHLNFVLTQYFIGWGLPDDYCPQKASLPRDGEGVPAGNQEPPETSCENACAIEILQGAEGNSDSVPPVTTP